MYFPKLRTTLFVVGLCAAALSAAPRLTLEDLLSVEPIGQTALSPDGKTFAFVREGQIVLMPSSGGWPVTLTRHRRRQNWVKLVTRWKRYRVRERWKYLECFGIRRAA